MVKDDGIHVVARETLRIIDIPPGLSYFSFPSVGTKGVEEGEATFRGRPSFRDGRRRKDIGYGETSIEYTIRLKEERGGGRVEGRLSGS